MVRIPDFKLAAFFAALSVCGLAGTQLWAESAGELQHNLDLIQQVGKEGQGHTAAVQALKMVGQSGPQELPAILASMKDDNPLADNWVRGAVDAIAERALASGTPLPLVELEAFIADHGHSPRSRRLAFEWLAKADESLSQSWIPKLLNDPSLELRREAVDDQLKKAAAAKEASNTEEAIRRFRTALNFARNVDQIDAATAPLRELGEEVDLPAHFGFITEWNLIGPFDNTDKSGFDHAFPPESKISLDATLVGKEGEVGWEVASTQDQYGLLDLNAALGKHKGSVAYAYTEFYSDQDRPVDLRLGCINANKIWLNGKLLTANHVYHAGRGIDQYVGKGQLEQGKNFILLKICQNEQEQSWAQDWGFQLRVCDDLGTAVHSTE